MSVTINGSGQVPVQVVTVNKTDTFSLSSQTWTDITGFTLNITPTSSSNKVLIVASVAIGVSQDFGYIRLLRNGTVIDVGDVAGSRPLVTGAFGAYPNGTPIYGMSQVPIVFLDSPSSTSAVTYKLQMRGGSNASAVYINRTGSDRDTADYEWRTPSTMVLMEISG
jgi:hypothetical protein